jgi:hypothetical protein
MLRELKEDQGLHYRRWRKLMGWGLWTVVEHLPSMCEVMCSVPSTAITTNACLVLNEVVKKIDVKKTSWRFFVLFCFLILSMMKIHWGEHLLSSIPVAMILCLTSGPKQYIQQTCGLKFQQTENQNKSFLP